MRSLQQLRARLAPESRQHTPGFGAVQEAKGPGRVRSRPADLRMRSTGADANPRYSERRRNAP